MFHQPMAKPMATLLRQMLPRLVALAKVEPVGKDQFRSVIERTLRRHGPQMGLVEQVKVAESGIIKENASE